MNIFLNEYFGFCFELNFELNHFWGKFNEKMNFQNVSNRATYKHVSNVQPPQPGKTQQYSISGGQKAQVVISQNQASLFTEAW